jgi:hypothetical protein
MTNDEIIALRVTEIGGHRHMDDYTVIWRGLPIGRIMKSSVVLWWWGCNFDGQLSLDDDSGNGIDLEDCKAKFLIAWTRIRAGLSDADIAKARASGKHQVSLASSSANSLSN